MTTANFQDAFEVFNEMLTELGEQPISEHVAKNDFGIQGGEDNATLYEWAHDYASECHTEKCAAKNEWRYQ